MKRRPSEIPNARKFVLDWCHKHEFHYKIERRHESPLFADDYAVVIEGVLCGQKICNLQSGITLLQAWQYMADDVQRYIDNEPGI